MFRKEIKDDIFIMCNDKQMYDSIESICNKYPIYPETVISILDGKLNYYNGFTFYCCARNGAKVRPEYRYIYESYDPRIHIGRYRKITPKKPACILGLSQEEYDYLDHHAREEGLSFTEYISRQLRI